MAPKDTPKATPKVKSFVDRTNSAKPGATPASIKKTMTLRKPIETKLLKAVTVQSRQRTMTVPKVTTPKSKENKPAPTPGSVTKSVKKASWKRRPKPAHSGVPVPEKMKKLMQQQSIELMNLDCSM